MPTPMQERIKADIEAKIVCGKFQQAYKKEYPVLLVVLKYGEMHTLTCEQLLDVLLKEPLQEFDLTGGDK